MLFPVIVAPFSRHLSLGYQVNHLARLMASALRQQIAACGVVPGQFAQLLALYEQDGLTQAELCQRVRIEQPTMANTLSRMQRDGLVERIPDPTDRRRALVRLTGRGRDIEGELVAAAQRVNAAATRGLGKREIDAFMSTLAKIIINLEGSTAQASTENIGGQHDHDY